jgi:hypothetical protein
MTKRTSLLFSLILAALVFAGSCYYLYKTLKYHKESVPVAVKASNLFVNAVPFSDVTDTMEGRLKVETANNIRKSLLNPSLPAELNLKMTFYPQAPFGNWDYPWQETCEEASALLIANEYFNYGWTAAQFNEQLLKLVDWEKKEFGDYKHTNIQQTAAILNDYLGLKTVIHENPTFENVQRIIAKGHFIIMTFAGKHLGNPFYKNGGPTYHAMVIKGYKEGAKVITSDVGTRHGENYVYSWATLEKASHDFAQPIEEGPKRMIEVVPPNDNGSK